MIEHSENLLNVESGIIVHGCNCIGGFGAGVAGAIANRYPVAAKEYHRLFTTYEDRPKKKLLGRNQWVKINDQLYIVNAFTQLVTAVKYGDRVAIPEMIESCLFKLIPVMIDAEIDVDVHAPRIGTGLGGLSWEQEVKPIFERFSEKLKDTVGTNLNVYFI